MRAESTRPAKAASSPEMVKVTISTILIGTPESCAERRLPPMA